MPFQINGGDIPSYATPKGKGYNFNLPEPTGMNGNGEPVGAVGKPSVRIYFDTCTEECWNYWRAWTGEALSATLTSVQMYNPWKSGGADFEAFTGGAIIRRPTYESMSLGLFEGVEIIIGEIE